MSNDYTEAALAMLRERCATVGAEIDYLPTVDSTNERAKALASGGAPHGSVVLADAQTHGRGRMGRSWFSPPGKNIYTSVILRPPTTKHLCALTMTMGVAVAGAVSPFLPTPATLEWPNDLFWGGKKLAGILTESAITGGRVEFVVVGIGIDVNETNFPSEIPATSMRLAAGREFDRIALLEVLYPLLEMWYNHFVAGGLEKIARAWRSRSDIFGRVVTLSRSGAPPISGIARKITEDGALVVETERGIETIHSGEVTGDPAGIG